MKDIEFTEVKFGPVSSTYRENVEYRHPTHTFKYLPELTLEEGDRGSSKTYYDIKEDTNFSPAFEKEFRMSTATEELAIQLAFEKAEKDPRASEDFGSNYSDMYRNNKFSSSDKIYYVNQLTETGLRVPGGWEHGRYQTDEKGRRYWPRIVLIGDQEVGELLLPEAGGRVVVEWDEVFGLPRKTGTHQGGKHLKFKNHTTHFKRFVIDPYLDERTGKLDVVVSRGFHSHSVMRVDPICLSIEAVHTRYYNCYAGNYYFRKVQGSLPVIEKIVNPVSVLTERMGLKMDPREVLLETMKKDFRRMPLPKFQEKYNL